MGGDPLKTAIKERLIYDPETGEFRWKPRAVKNRPNGCKASSKHGHYMRIRLSVDGKEHKLQAHRVAWLLMTGEWPACLVDHRNRDKLDNRWSNLRAATYQQNTLNRVLKIRELPIGVRQKRGSSVFEAAIQPNGKYVYLGSFPTAALASEAYQLAFKRFHGSEWRPDGH